jgi:molybdopterin-binding protein
MAHVKFTITAGGTMASVLTVESLEEMGLKVGDEVTLLVKAVNVLPMKG